MHFSDTNESKSGILRNVEYERGTSSVNAILSMNDRIDESRVDMTNELWYPESTKILTQL